MWYGELSTLKVGEPIVSTVNKVELVNEKIYTIKEVFEYPSRNYITLHGMGDKKYGTSFFRDITPEEVVKLRGIKIDKLLKK